MKRWLAIQLRQLFAGSVAALGLGILVGCQPTFLVKENYEQAPLTTSLNVKIDEHCPPPNPLSQLVKAPPDVNNPERPPRYMTLQEAIALALENGTVSGNNPGSGIPDPTFARFAGAGSTNSQTDNIRVLAMNPAIQNAAIEASLSRFDAKWISSMSWTTTDALAGVPNLPGYLGTVPGQTASLQSSIVKAFAGGGVANVSFLTDYRQPNNAANNPFAFGPLNPQYSMRVGVGFEQPIWQNFGTEINSLLSRFPSVTGNQFASTAAGTGLNTALGNIAQIAGAPVEGTLISRLRFDQSRAEFERNVHILVLNAEVAYWNLYNKYGQLYSFEENLRILQRVYQESYYQYQAGKLDPYKFHQFKGQFEEFRNERYRALQEVLTAEINLRAFIGLTVEDGTRIVPITPPSLSELRPNWESALQDALTLRPELVLARDNLKYHQYLLSIQKNNLKPDLRAYGRYEVFGDGSSVIGSNGTFTDSSGTPHTTDAGRSLAGGHLADWQIGLFLNVPLGFRYEYAAIRSARLQLSQSYYFLRDQEERTTRYLANQYQDVSHWYKRIQASRSERLAYLESLKNLDKQIKVGKITYSDQNVQYLSVQRSYANALVKEFSAIAEYNNSLAKLEWAKGTVLKYNNVHISEGPLPQAAQVRAVEYEKERSRSLVLRERPDSLTQPGRLCAAKECDLPSLDGPMPTSDHSVVPPPADLPGKAETLPKLPMKFEEGPAKEEKLPPSRVDDSLRPLSMQGQGTSGLKQVGAMGAVAVEEVVTPTFRSVPDRMTPYTVEPMARPANQPATFSPPQGVVPIPVPAADPLVPGRP